MKRIRVDLDVPDSGVEWFTGPPPTSALTGASYTFRRQQVRSVEVVEPERWTELVLRVEGPLEVDITGHTMELHFIARNWDPFDAEVLSCTEREEYPNG